MADLNAVNMEELAAQIIGNATANGLTRQDILNLTIEDMPNLLEANMEAELDGIEKGGKQVLAYYDDFADRCFSISLEVYDKETDDCSLEDYKLDLTREETRDHLDKIEADEPDGDKEGLYLYEYIVFEYDGQSSKSQSDIVSNTRADGWLEDYIE